MSYKRVSFDFLSAPLLGVIVALVMFILGSQIYRIWTADIGPDGCPKGQKAITGYQGGRYTHLCVEPGTTIPLAPH